MKLLRFGDQRPPGEAADEHRESLQSKTGSDAAADAALTCFPFRIGEDHVKFERLRSDRSRATHDRNPNSPVRAPALKIVVIDNETEDLSRHVPAWEELADHAIETNTFYEPWLLRPALKTLHQGSPLRLVFVYETASPESTGVSRLCGFFPLEAVYPFGNLPATIWRLWKHLNCFLCTPLIRPERARETLAALLQWAGADGGARLLYFSHIRGDGPFHDLLVGHARDTGTLQRITNRFARAFWRPQQKPDAYLKSALSAGVRKEYRRQRKRLGELGRLEFRTLRQGGELQKWLEQFLNLEASGWKAREGLALGTDTNHRNFVCTAVQEGFARNQMRLQGLFLDDRPAAMLLSFLSGSGAFAFKIAYDEAFAKYSPGVQVMLDVMASVHSDSRVAWVDSCAEPNHPMINRLWKERRVIESVLVSTGSWLGNLAVVFYPAAQWLIRLIRACSPKQPLRKGVSCAAAK